MVESVLLFRDALYGALVIGFACSVLGVYVVLRRIVFVGAALAELSSAGIALALWVGGMGWASGVAGHPLMMSLVVTLIGAAVFGLSGSGRALIPADATLGTTYAIAAGVGILMISKATTGEAHDMFLHGNILGIARKDALVLLGVVTPVLLMHLVFYKEFLFVSFDRETARTLGYRVAVWNLLLYLGLGLVIAVAMQFAGVILVFNYLVLPAVTGLLLSNSMRGVFIWAIATGLLATVVGFSMSIPFDLPSGPAIIAVSGVITILAWVFRRIRQR